jgi:hypothetical protein
VTQRLGERQPVILTISPLCRRQSGIPCFGKPGGEVLMGNVLEWNRDRSALPTMTFPGDGLSPKRLSGSKEGRTRQRNGSTAAWSD